MLKSFFLNENGFVAPWTGLSGSWIVGVLAGAATLFGTVSPALADATCYSSCWGIPIKFICVGDDFTDCDATCDEEGSYCYCDVECS